VPVRQCLHVERCQQDSSHSVGDTPLQWPPITMHKQLWGQQSSQLIEHQVGEQVLVEEDLVGATGQS